MGNCTNLRDKGYIQLPGLTSSFSEGLSLQAWIYPDSHQNHCRIFDLGRGKEADNIFLAESKKSDDVRFGVYQGSKRGDLLLLKGAFRTGRWTQITVTVDSGGTAKGYVNGKLAGSQEMKPPKAASGGIRHRCFVGKSNWRDDKYYDGRMAELRIWDRVLSAQEVAANYDVELVGDEAGLLGYWPLADFGERGPADLGPGQRHGAATKGVEDSQVHDLPVARIPAAVGVKRTIVTDYVPFTAFPSDRPLAGVDASPDPDAQRKANVDAAGRAALAEGQGAPDDETIVTCPVWDVTLCGVEGAAEVTLTFDRDVDLVTVSEGALAVVPQKGGVPLAWELPPDATVRVRIPAARQLELPCATVRAGGGTTRLDFPSVGSLVEVTPEQLSTSGGEAPPPLPSDASAETKDAVALYLRQVACAAPVAKVQSSSGTTVYASAEETASAGEYSTSGWMDDAIGGIEDAFDKGSDAVVKSANDVMKGVGEAVEDVGRALQEGLDHLQKQTSIVVSGSQSLVLYTADAAGDLIKRASKVTAGTSVAAIESSIGRADKLCVSSVNAAANIVEIVGEIAGSAFRVVVHGIEEAISAMRSFFDRVGLVFRDLVEWLASLFSWTRFKHDTDLIHDWSLEQLDYLADAIAAAGDRAEGALEGLATVFSDSDLSQAFIKDIVPKTKKIPGSSELEFVVSHVQNALDIGVNTGRLPSFPLLSLPAGPGQALTASIGSLPLDDFWNLRCGQLLGPLDAVWSELIDAVREGLALAAAAGENLVEWLKAVLTSRIKLPVFTQIFETILFPGWKLTPLRLLALGAAIPAQVAGWKLDALKGAKLDAAGAMEPGGSSSASDGGASTPTVRASADPVTTQAQGGRASSGDDDFLEGVAVAALVFEAMGSVVSVVENAIEMKARDTMKSEDLIASTGVLALCGSITGAGTAICGFCTVSKAIPPEARNGAYTGLSFELLNAVCQFMGGVGMLENTKNRGEAQRIQEQSGWCGMVFGTVSFGFASQTAFTLRGAGSGTRAGDIAVSIWVMRALQFLLDGTAHAVERSTWSDSAKTNAVRAAGAASIAASGGGLYYAVQGVR